LYFDIDTINEKKRKKERKEMDKKKDGYKVSTKK